MARMRYFADLVDGTEVAFDSVDYDQGWTKKPRGYDKTTSQWLRCTRIITMKSNPSRHQCDARCFNATGRTMNCECSCGGKNHGKGKIAA